MLVLSKLIKPQEKNVHSYFPVSVLARKRATENVRAEGNNDGILCSLCGVSEGSISYHDDFFFKYKQGYMSIYTTSFNCHSVSKWEAKPLSQIYILIVLFF